MSIGIAVAQHTVNGTVVSAEDGEPIIGATVKVKDTNTGVVTDIDGKFSLSTSTAKPTLEVTYLCLSPWRGGHHRSHHCRALYLWHQPQERGRGHRA